MSWVNGPVVDLLIVLALVVGVLLPAARQRRRHEKHETRLRQRPGLEAKPGRGGHGDHRV